MFRKAATGAALVLLASAANATDLSYNYAELRWVDTELESVDGDGFQIGGSYELSDQWLVVADLSAIDYDFNVDVTTFSVGAGYLVRYDERFDFVGYARLIRANADFTGGDEDENGYAISAGTRAKPADNIELRAFLNHVDVFDRDTFIELGGDYYFDPRVSVGATLQFAGDADTLTLGVRWFFGD
ncbi:MAG: outer membrane beta-barrel protein [Pseudomonadota bacterium]